MSLTMKRMAQNSRSSERKRVKKKRKGRYRCRLIKKMKRKMTTMTIRWPRNSKR